jgi:tol-pal system protein YbgF
MSRWPLLLWIAVGACAPRANVVDLDHQLEAMRRQSARDHKQLDQLENRILVLEDRLETAEVERKRATQEQPHLPVVKRSPVADEQPADPDPTQQPATDTLGGGDVEVVYEGDAARDDHPRPQVALGADSSDDLSDAETTANPTPAPRRQHARPAMTPRRSYGAGDMPDPAAVTDRISVGGNDTSASSSEEDPITVYKAAYAALGRHEHADAIAGFQHFLSKWPDHDYADNAQYWLGEAYYDQRQWDTALEQFRRVVKRYPAGNKAPDALLKIGFCYAKLSDAANARDVLAQVIEIYPKTDAAKLAAKRLDELRQ